jgi:hypothetical protein
VATSDGERHYYTIPSLQVRYAFAGFLNDAPEFMAQNVAFFHGWDEAVKEMQV